MVTIRRTKMCVGEACNDPFVLVILGGVFLFFFIPLYALFHRKGWK
jgi:hypothetical protein